MLVFESAKNQKIELLARHIREKYRRQNVISFEQGILMGLK
jgi:hypothetical protein